MAGKTFGVNGGVVEHISGVQVSENRVDLARKAVVEPVRTRGDRFSYRVRGRLLDAEKEKPLAGYRVRVVYSQPGRKAEEVADVVADPRGAFFFQYEVGPDAVRNKTPQGFRFLVRDPKGNEVSEVKERVVPGEAGDLELKVPTEAYRVRMAVPIRDLDRELELQLPDSLHRKLRSRGIRTLEDIRLAGELRRVKGFAADDPSLAKLEAHAYLHLLSPKLGWNKSLIARGYDSPSAIAGAPRSRFVASTRGFLKQEEATHLHARAIAYRRLLDRLSLTWRTGLPGSPWLPPDLTPQEVRDERPLISGHDFDPPCYCPDYDAAVSPRAYLVNLLDYTTRHLRRSYDFRGLIGEYYEGLDLTDFKVQRRDGAVDFDWGRNAPHPDMGTNRFSARWTGQVKPRPEYDYDEWHTFRIAADGGARLWVNDQLIIDHWIDEGPIVIDSDPYHPVLLKGGEWNDIKVEYFNEEGNAALQLFWETRQFGRPEIIPESQLKPPDAVDLQYLVHTFYQPFADLLNSREAAEKKVLQIRLCIEVLRRFTSTGPEGLIEGVEKEYLCQAYQVLLTQIGTSRDELRLARLAQGAGDEDKEEREALANRLGFPLDSGEVDCLKRLYLHPGEITELELKKLFGLSETLSTTPGDDDSEPLVQTWRKEYLRTLWAQQDRREDETTWEGPVIDPDLIGPDDLRNPVEDDPSFETWRHRRGWVDGQIKALSKRRKAWGDSTGNLMEEGSDQVTYVPDLTAMFERMYQSLSYFHLVIHRRVRFQPWEENVQGRFDSIWDKLANGTEEEVERNKAKVEKDLKLTVESFLRLMEICAKDQHWWADPRNEQVSEQEWQEVYSILVQAQKRSLLDKWQEEEMSCHIRWPEPEHFWISLTEPKEGEWSARDRPWIDPDLVGLADLPDPAFGEQARELWNQRRNQLDHDIPAALQAQRESGTFENVTEFETLFNEAWGELPAQDTEWLMELGLDDTATWLSIVDGLEMKLNDPDGEISQLAKAAIRTHLCMTGKEFLGLVSIKAKAGQTQEENQPTEVDWHRLRALLKRVRMQKLGFEAMLQQAFGAPLDEDDGWLADLDEPADSNTRWSSTVDKLKSGLERSGPVDTESAKATIKNGLHMNVEDFRLLMETRAREIDLDLDLARKPRAEDWAKVYAILTQVQKKRREYPFWIAAEDTLEYWHALKARLPKWRASVEHRQRWQQTLRANSSRPIVDPDMLCEKDFKRPVTDNKAYELWVQRQAEIVDMLSGLPGSATARADWLKGKMSGLGLSPEEFKSLHEQREAGEDIRGRLDQLGLTVSAYLRLVPLYAFVEGGGDLDASEWEEIKDILISAKKLRLFATWRDEEKDKAITLGPDFFQLHTEVPDLRSWRATLRDRKEWLKTLEARIAQEQGIAAALDQAIEAAEQAALPILRTNLICEAIKLHVTRLREQGSLGPPGSFTFGKNLDSMSKWVTNQFLIDAQASSCQKTTRIQQAIETLQVILWSARTGLLQDTHPELKLEADNFEQEWPWIGSYASWRAAVFAYIYPENILLPSVRKLERQTSGFEMFIESMRSGGRVTPQLANESVQAYSDFFMDMCDLQLSAIAPCTVSAPNDAEPQRRIFLFSLGKRTRRVYWSVYDEAAYPAFAQPLWEPVPGLEEIEITQIIGAQCNLSNSNPRILLFLKGNEDKTSRIFFITCQQSNTNDDVNQWSECKAHDIAKSDDSWKALLTYGKDDTIPPCILVYDSKGYQFHELDQAVTDWEVFDETAGSFTKYGHDLTRDLAGLKPLHAVKRERWDYLILAKLPGMEGFSERFLVTPLTRPYHGHWANEYRIADAFGSDGAWVGYFYEPTRDHLGAVRHVSGCSTLECYTLDTESDGYLYPSHCSIPSVAKAVDVFLGPAGIHRPGSSTKFYFCFRSVVDSMNHHLLSRLEVDEDGDMHASDGVDIAPRILDEIPTPTKISIELNKGQREQLSSIASANSVLPISINIYLNEAYYYIPIQTALQLQKHGFFIEALDWFRKAYDYGCPEGMQFVYPCLDPSWTFHANGLSPRTAYQLNIDDWLEDPLDVHATAAMCYPWTDARFVLLSLAHCLLEYADSEFTFDTSESIVRARDLYLQALAVLDHQVLHQTLDDCEEIIAELTMAFGDLEPLDMALRTKWRQVLAELREVRSQSSRAWAISKLLELVATDSTPELQLQAARKIIDAAINVPTSLQDTLLTASELETIIQRILDRAGLKTRRDFINIPGTFCIPPNPVLAALRLHAKLNLYKISTCRNIAGIERELEPYAAPTDTSTGLPTITDGQLALPGAVTIQPTQYRYQTLIERAKQLVNTAQQIESAYLSFLEKSDQASYNLLRARQDSDTAKARVELQRLRLTEAEDGKLLADEQWNRADFTYTHYHDLIVTGWLEMEDMALACLQAAAIAPSVEGMIGAFKGAPPSVSSGIASLSSELSMYASFERREQEWKFQRGLAEKDKAIAEMQQTLASDRYDIVDQEKAIADLEARHTDEVVSFLRGKFTSRELYDWMGRVMSDVYRYFLQQATATAKIAENQLAFERQKLPMAFILPDYWTPPSEGTTIGSDGDSTDRKGLTGSARLLQDIYRLDQYAFETDQRKLQLTKILSLARLDPFTFQRFRETGVMVFETPMALFDRDFPGHYLRLVKRVRTSVIALIPPTEGIRATLSSSGVSRVVIGGGPFQEVVVRRDPESVALTSPMNATGLFELQQEPEKMLPFEAMGVDARWELRMPKAANPFDYRSIADVLVTIEYTALDSYDYRQEVIRRLDRSLSADRPFSFRQQFADQWYDLHNPDQTDTPLVVRFRTRREDFPPNVEELRIQQVLLYFARAEGASFEVPVAHLHFAEKGTSGFVGGAATSVDGIISTRRGNGSSWLPMLGKAPVGEWELALEDNEKTRGYFRDEQIGDILFVVTFSGRTPEWPA
jgi:hypothetical protein